MDLMQFLPDYYHGNKTMKELQRILSNQSDILATLLENEFVQVYPTLATDKLARWEAILDIPIATDANMDYRRERVLSKLYVHKTTTVQDIKDIVKLFTYGDVEIIEYPEEYRFLIRFINLIGVPPYIDNVKYAIEQLKPAHLDYDIEFLYNTHEQVKGHTHAALKKYTHENIRNEVLHG